MRGMYVCIYVVVAVEPQMPPLCLSWAERVGLFGLGLGLRLRLTSWRNGMVLFYSRPAGTRRPTECQLRAWCIIPHSSLLAASMPPPESPA